MRWISRAGSRESILSWLGDTSMLSRWQESYNTAVERLAVLTGTPILDLRRDFLLSHEYKSLMSYDGIHPTDRGHDLIEEKSARCSAARACRRRYTAMCILLFPGL